MEASAMIIELKFYTVQCDLCKRDYSILEDTLNAFHTIDEAEEAIKKNGWTIMHNQRGSFPRILCPICNKEAEDHMQNNSNGKRFIK
jgi:hypothetical protein